MLCADAAVPKMDIIGPYGLMHYLATMRGFTYRYDDQSTAIDVEI